MPRPSDIAKADLDTLVDQLTTQEATSLIAGVGWWHTFAVPRLGIPAIKVSDGPNGIRGNHFFMGTPAKALPCATALGATFDTDLVGKAASKLLADEARLRGASIILAPTVNIQRSPLGGRSFESYSEDPHLSGHIASAYISNVQARGIGCCIKHFVANDMENDRHAYSSIVSPRALREIYLMPFMIAEKYAKPWCYMTAYNRLNGLHMSENTYMLTSLLRETWKSNALIMSDWWGVYGLSESINSGLDLEMPGVAKWRTLENVASALKSKKVTIRTVKERAKKVVEMVQKCAKEAPEILDGDGIERTQDSPEDVRMMRTLASESIVLLKNSNKVLPLSLSNSDTKTIAIIGPNAKALLVSGGGSASLKASYFVTPYDGIVNAIKESGSKVKVVYSEGVRATVSLPTIDTQVINEEGKPGFTASWHSHSDSSTLVPIEQPIKTQFVDEGRMFFGDSAPVGLTPTWTLRLKTFLKPQEADTPFEFSLLVDGRARLYVDKKLIIDNWDNQPKAKPGLGASVELRGITQLTKGTNHELFVEFSNVRGDINSADSPISVVGPVLRIGGAPVVDDNLTISQSVKLAQTADVVVLVVGLNGDWESEGHDRTTLKLPGRTDELVEKVVAANPKAVVVTQSGSAIEMPWADKVSTLVHAWYLGNATGDAIADVLFGKVNPSGKLSITFPKRLEDTPSYGHFASQNGQVRYAEDIYVGYKHYLNASVEPLFPFGFGLSYTTFKYSDLTISPPLSTSVADDFSVSVSFSVSNTGPVQGSETAQLYIALPSTPWGHLHPPVQLRSFFKVKGLAPGATKEVTLTLDKYAVSYWEESIEKWRAEIGTYLIKVGSSSSDIQLEGMFEVGQVLEWNGL